MGDVYIDITCPHRAISLQGTFDVETCLLIERFWVYLFTSTQESTEGQQK